MSRIIFCILFLFGLSLVKAQSFPTELILSSDEFNSYKYEVYPLKISNYQDVKISGTFASDAYVLIKPTLSYNIIVLPLNVVTNVLNSGLPDPSTTTITTKPRGGKPLPQVIVYPNPVYTNLTFTTSSNLVNYYTILNNTGIIVVAQSISPTNNVTINVSNLTSGIYFLKLNLDNGQQLSIQFIKN